MSRLPQDDQGLYLRPAASPHQSSFLQALHLFGSLFGGSEGSSAAQHGAGAGGKAWKHFDARSCRVTSA